MLACSDNIGISCILTGKSKCHTEPQLVQTQCTVKMVSLQKTLKCHRFRDMYLLFRHKGKCCKTLIYKYVLCKALLFYKTGLLSSILGHFWLEDVSLCLRFVFIGSICFYIKIRLLLRDVLHVTR